MQPRSYFKVVLSGSVIISLDYVLLKEQYASEPAMSSTRIMKIKEEIVRVMVLDTEIFSKSSIRCIFLNKSRQILQKYVFKKHRRNWAIIR